MGELAPGTAVIRSRLTRRSPGDEVHDGNDDEKLCALGNMHFDGVLAPLHLRFAIRFRRIFHADIHGSASHLDSLQEM